LGWDEIAVVWVDDDEVTSKAFALADNRTAELGDYDEEALADLINDVGSLNPGLLESSGWDDKAVQELLDRVEQIELPADVDDVPEDVPAVSKLGDVWLLGDHRVMCGNSTNKDDLKKLKNGIAFDLLLTDPPYGIDASNMTLGTGKKQFHRGEDWDKDRPDLLSIMRESDLQIIWGGNYFSDQLPISNDWLCWHKKNDGLSFSEFELAWSNLKCNTRLFSHHWSGEQKLHPTMKPVAVMAWCFEYAPKSKNVFDPFGGSGSTLIAAQETNRTAYLMELDPKYVDVICARFQKLTGVLPVLESSGKVHDFLNA
jgi:hypothetical protein